MLLLSVYMAQNSVLHTIHVINNYIQDTTDPETEKENKLLDPPTEEDIEDMDKEVEDTIQHITSMYNKV